MRHRHGIFGAMGATLMTWIVGDALLHQPIPAPFQTPRWLLLGQLWAMVGLIVLPTGLYAHKVAHGFPRRYQAFAWFVAVMRLCLRLAGGFVGGLVLELLLRGSIDTPSAVTAAACHAGGVAALMGWSALRRLLSASQETAPL